MAVNFFNKLDKKQAFCYKLNYEKIKLNYSRI